MDDISSEVLKCCHLDVSIPMFCKNILIDIEKPEQLNKSYMIPLASIIDNPEKKNKSKKWEINTALLAVSYLV